VLLLKPCLANAVGVRRFIKLELSQGVTLGFIW